ncbi:MAG: hypothetical protein JW893_01950 [Candidatus Omnitrophica bacterium]|nr:hypothetical protein [Candidatus Omnitrophota bacterium]
MLLGNKKSRSEKQNWCVVLNPILSEIDKKRIALKISEVFSLSSEEASDLVESTPIILLDNLNQDIAHKVKGFFEAANAQIVLTNDTFRKRKYYRTVWPEPPNLAFLNTWESHQKNQEVQEVLGPDEALNAIRMMRESPEKSEHAEVMPIPGLPEPERRELESEIENWKRSHADLEKEVSRLTEIIRKLEEARAQRPLPAPELSLLQGREKEIKEARALLSNLEEKYDVLKDEYREARELFEEKMVQTRQEMETLRKRNKELEENARVFQNERLDFGSRIKEKEEQGRQYRGELETKNKQLEERLQQATQMIDQWRLKAEELAESVKDLERQKENLERGARVSGEQLSRWREKQETLEQQIHILQEAQQTEKTLREKVEDRLREVDKDRAKLYQELEEARRTSQSWESKYKGSEERVTELCRTCEKQETELQGAIQKLQGYDAQIEEAKRQLQEMRKIQAEQGIHEKRSQLADRLVEKEGYFRELVEKQKEIESEIRSREQEIEKILAEQEIIEKEIVEGKRVHLHFQDQVNREKNGRFRLAKNDQASEEKKTHGNR